MSDPRERPTVDYAMISISSHVGTRIEGVNTER